MKVRFPFRYTIPDKTCVSVADCRESASVIGHTVHRPQEGIPGRTCVSVADCSEASVLRPCPIGPYVPLRRGSSDSVSVIRHTGRRPLDYPPSRLQPHVHIVGRRKPSRKKTGYRPAGHTR